MVTLLLFLLILGLIIFIHEFGHFIFAKKAGIYVYEFSLGFGPKLFSFKRKNDETTYMIKLIPLGGYVALAGETYDENSTDEDKIPADKKLYNKSFLSRLLVMIAGVFNNFVLGFLLLFIMGLIYGSVFTTNELSTLDENNSLYLAGAREGDKVVSIDGYTTKDFDDIQTRIAIAGEKSEISVTIEKQDGSKSTVKLKPKYNEEDKRYYYGISIKQKVEKGFIPAIKYAATKFVSLFKQLIIIIANLFTGKLGINSLSGPVGIYQVVGDAKASIYSLLFLTAYLSINVGFMNLLPFPAFDGGRAFLLIIEKITKKKVPLKVETIINNIGFYLLMGLMLLITVKDILNLF